MIAATATFVAAVSASAAKIYWVVRPGNTSVYAVGDYDDSWERARTNDNAKHVFFDGGNDNPIGNCWKTGLDGCDSWEDIYRASGWGQCNYS